jgi:hypothetical protein
MEVLMKRVLVASIGVLAGTYGFRANAQETNEQFNIDKGELAAPISAFEIGVAGMYSQGFGNLTRGGGPVRIQDIANAGGGVALDLGWRFAPAFALGVYGSGSQFGRDTNIASGTELRTVAAGVQGRWFLRPYRKVNPWLGLGTGYRGYWVTPDVGGTTATHGWQIARLQVGVDFRASREIAVGPFIGGSVDTFFTQKVPGGDYQNLSGPPVAGFVEAGIIGRFDLGGHYVPHTRAIATR